MVTLFERIKNSSGVIKQYIIFSIGSVLGAIIDYVITLLLVNYLAFQAWIALGIAMIFSASIVYLYHRSITFNATTNTLAFGKDLAKFVVLAFFIYLLRLLVLWSASMWVESLEVTLLLSLVVASVINYFLTKKIIFK